MKTLTMKNIYSVTVWPSQSVILSQIKKRSIMYIRSLHIETERTKNFPYNTLAARYAKHIDMGQAVQIATHSPILMAMPGALIYEITETGMNATPLEQVEHYIVTKTFLNNPAAYFREEEQVGQKKTDLQQGSSSNACILAR